MKSYDVCQSGAPLVAQDRPAPVPAGSEVLLRVLAAGVCHSDIHFWEGVYDLGGGRQMRLVDRGMRLPLTMGHENVGEVVAIGPEARGVAVGDRCLVYPWIGCGTCGVCRRGDEHLCLKPGFLGAFRPGGYAEQLLVPHPRYLLDIGTLPPEQAAPLACAGVTGYSAVLKLGDLLTREPVVIIGLGGVGSMALACVTALGGRAIVCDIDPRKRARALDAGAIAAIDNHAEGALQQVTEAAGGAVWAVVDFVGAGDTVRFATDALTKGGTLVVVGLFGGEITMSTPYFPMRAMTVRGSYVGSLAELSDLLALVKQRGPLNVPIETRPLPRAYDALLDLKAGRVLGRVVLTPGA
jgi:D-arabinose 1-dehydrogenase-like Zn-dependent alcohol dehydrogenase